MFLDTEQLNNEITLIAENTESIWNMIEWCVKAMVKHHNRGDEMLYSHLVNTSTVGKIITACKKQYAANCGEYLQISNEQMKGLKEEIAQIIWELYIEETSE